MKQGDAKFGIKTISANGIHLLPLSPEAKLMIELEVPENELFPSPTKEWGATFTWDTDQGCPNNGYMIVKVKSDLNGKIAFVSGGCEFHTEARFMK